MTTDMNAITPGAMLTYNDGRPGHTRARAEVLSVNPRGMLVQFDDRADTTFIAWDDQKWLKHITLEPDKR
jgi:hypothetical protein